MQPKAEVRPSLCPCCGAGESDRLFDSTDAISGETFEIRLCRGCRLASTHPRPFPEALPSYYARRHPSGPPARYETADAGPRVAYLASLAKPGTMLEVGCGKGLVIDGMRRLGWNVVGTELSSSACRYARSLGLSVRDEPLERCAFSPQAFDLIALFHVLEHLPDPVGDLRRCQRWLRRGGTLVLEVPNFGSWYARLFRGHWFHLDPPRHLFHFTPETLREVLRETGLEVVVLTTTQARYDAFGAVQSLLNMILRERNLLNAYLTGEASWSELTNRSRLALGLSLFFLSIAFPVMWALGLLLRPFASGGTLRARCQVTGGLV